MSIKLFSNKIKTSLINQQPGRGTALISILCFPTFFTCSNCLYVLYNRTEHSRGFIIFYIHMKVFSTTPYWNKYCILGKSSNVFLKVTRKKWLRPTLVNHVTVIQCCLPCANWIQPILAADGVFTFTCLYFVTGQCW